MNAALRARGRGPASPSCRNAARRKRRHADRGRPDRPIAIPHSPRGDQRTLETASRQLHPSSRSAKTFRSKSRLFNCLRVAALVRIVHWTGRVRVACRRQAREMLAMRLAEDGAAGVRMRVATRVDPARSLPGSPRRSSWHARQAYIVLQHHRLAASLPLAAPLTRALHVTRALCDSLRARPVAGRCAISPAAGYRPSRPRYCSRRCSAPCRPMTRRCPVSQ